MVNAVIKHLSPWRALLACLSLLALAASGYGLAQADIDGWASADPDLPSSPQALTPAGKQGAVSGACASTVLGALGDIATRVYHEGVFSERTAAASAFIERSRPLREAVERDEPRAARTAAKALLATGHLTSLRVTVAGSSASSGSGSGSGSGVSSSSSAGSHAGSSSDSGSGVGSGERVLVSAGASSALAPLHGTIVSQSGGPIAKFVTSVWTDNGFISEVDGIDQGQAALRAHGRSLGGSFGLPAGPAGEPNAQQGTIAAGGVTYDYTSLPVSAYPEGRLQRAYILRTPASIAPLCAPTREGTLTNTIGRVAKLIYTSEAGPHALVEVRRVQRNQALLQAVAAREPEATRLAIDKLLNQHIVRMRVSAGGQLLSDVGGPYVLAPVGAPLRLHGKRIGTVVLSIQDDEGYKRLAQRLAGVDVLMYMQSNPASGSRGEATGGGGDSRGGNSEGGDGQMQLVKNSLGPLPAGASVPASGSYTYHGHMYRVLTLHAQAFPSGPLRIVVLIPIPYS